MAAAGGDDRVLPRGRLRADEQLRRHRAGAARARPPGRLRGRGVVRGDARGAGVRGAADATRPAAGGRGGAGAVLEGLHPRDGTGLPQADDRAAGGVHRADFAGALRRGALRRRPPGGDLRRGPAGRHRRGQRRLLPGDPRVRAAVGADRLVQPARAEGPRAAAGVLGLRARRPSGLGGVPRRVRPRPRRRCTASSPPSASSAAHRRSRTASSSTSRRGSTSTLYPAEADYERSRPLAPTWHRLDTCVRAVGRDVRPAGRASPRARARSSTSRSAASARPTSS